MKLSDGLGATHFFVSDKDGRDGEVPVRAFSVRKEYAGLGHVHRSQRRIVVTLADGRKFVVHQNWARVVAEGLLNMIDDTEECA